MKNKYMHLKILAFITGRVKGWNLNENDRSIREDIVTQVIIMLQIRILGVKIRHQKHINCKS